MKQASISVTLRVNFSYDENRTPIGEAIYHARELAIKPCFHSIVEGVSLQSVNIEEEN